MVENNDIVKIFFKYMNPIRLISLFFLLCSVILKKISDFWAFLADIIDGISITVTDTATNKSEEYFKNIPISERVGRIIIIVILIFLISLWSHFVTKGILQ